MVQPKPPPLSIRPPPALLARVVAFAAKQKITRHLALIMLLERGLNAAEPDQKQLVVRAQPVAKPAVAVSVPTLERKRFNPQPKKGKK